MGGRRPRLGGREWSSWPHVRPAALYTAAGGSLTVATVVVGFSKAVSATQAIALGVLATLATGGGLIGLVIPDAWAAWRRGFQQGFKFAMNRQAQRTQSSYGARRTRRPVAAKRPEPVAEDRPEPVADDKPEPLSRGDASGDSLHVIVSLPARRGKPSVGKSSRGR